MSSTPNFAEILENRTNLPAKIQKKVVLFRDLIVSENKKQNLTRLLSPEEFYWGHLQDVLALVRWNSFKNISNPEGFVDYGSGCGVPGILAAILSQDSWILVESERRKAEFLSSAIKALKLEPSVSVFAGRGEDFLVNTQVSVVVARAVGSVEKIYSQIHRCSTWNNLFLFKGKKWDEEWKGFESSKYSGQLNVIDILEYPVDDPDDPSRVHKLIHLTRG